METNQFVENIFKAPCLQGYQGLEGKKGGQYENTTTFYKPYKEQMIPYYQRN